MSELAGSVALVTGGGGGIGAAVGQALARAGARTLVTDLTAPELSPTDDVSLRSLALDVTRPEAVSTLFELVAAEEGPVDILVNCAGIREISPIVDLSYEDWSRVLAVNLTGSFLTSQAFAKSALGHRRGGVIVNLASTAGLFGIPERPAYVATKHGVVGLTKQMAIELAPHGIRVNAVAPGIIRTPMTEAYFSSPDAVDRMTRSHPLGGYGAVEDVAHAILYLVSPKAKFTTGVILSVDGGFAAGKVL